MKKLMILMAAVATSVLAFGEEAANSLKRVFDATTATDLAGWSIPEGEEKATLADGVLTLATGSEAATWLAKPGSEGPYMMGDGTNYYFDVSLNMLGQALDEVPTLPKDAKLALFLLDTTDMDGAPEGTNLFALAKHPTDSTKILVKLDADVETLLQTGDATRLTVQTYKNVFKASGGGANSAFVVYQNGGKTAGGATSPVLLSCYYTVKEDNSVNWASYKSVDGSYLSGGVLDSTVSGKKNHLLLSMMAGVDGQSFTGLGFAGNARIKKVEINDSGFDFIAPDETTTMMTLTDVTVTVDPANAYDAMTGALSASCTITVTPNVGLEVLTYTDATYLSETNGVFYYTYAEGNDVFFKAEAACAKVGDTAYATLNEALLALGKNGGGTLTLSRNIELNDTIEPNGKDPLGYLTFTGNIVLDLAGKAICLPGDSTEDNHGVVYLEDGALVITNSTAELGKIQATVTGRPAVCCVNGDVDEAGNPSATIKIAGGKIEGAIRDIVLESDEEGGEAPEGAVPNITITGGKFSVDPTTWVADGYAATKDDGEDYWTVAKSGKPAVEPVKPGLAIDYEAEAEATDAATAINTDKAMYIEVPDGVTNTNAYLNLLEAKVVSDTGTQKFAVIVDLTAQAKVDIQTQIDAEIKKVDIAAVAAATGGTEQIIETKPGLYYSVIAGDTLTGMTVKSSTPATGATLSISLPKFTGAGFYQIQATVAPLPVAK